MLPYVLVGVCCGTEELIVVPVVELVAGCTLLILCDMGWQPFSS